MDPCGIKKKKQQEKSEKTKGKQKTSMVSACSSVFQLSCGCLFCKCSAKENTSEVWEAMECSTQGQAPQTTVGCHCFVSNRHLYLGSD